MVYLGGRDWNCDFFDHRRLHRFGNAHTGELMYDLLMRLPLLGWAVFAAILQLGGLVHYMDIVNKLPMGFVYVIHVAMRLSTFSFVLLIAAAVILRSHPSEKARGLEPRISALAGTFMTYVIALFPRCELSLSLEMVSTMLILVGTIGAAVALARLGRSFSVMAETRQLVTSGPYRLVRHPLYLTEQIATIGLFMQFASPLTALLLALQIGFQLRRMQNEEAILAATFPEYMVYRQTTARLVPGIY
jgi:protein-S-isoprenylcysteine O-methyltransferase Ste14